MFRSVKFVLLHLTVLFCLALTATASRAESNLIQKIDPAAFDRLIKNAARPMIVAMMASWCAPCIRELPTLNALYRRYGGRGVDIVGVSLDFGGPGAMQPLIDRLKVTFPVYWLGEAGARSYNITGIPLLWIVKNGEVREKILGSRPKSFLEKKIVELIGKKKPAP